MSTKYKCTSNKPANYVCTNKNCKDHAFICESNECCGKQKHSGCYIQLIDNFTSLEALGSKEFKSYTQKICSFYNNLLDLVKQQKQEFLEWTKLYYSSYQKLTYQNKEAKNRIFSGTQAQKLYDAWNCCTSQQKKETFAEISKLQKNIAKDLNFIKKLFIQSMKRNEDDRRTSTTQSLIIESKILWKEEDQNTLLRLFLNESKIKQINCLYRASTFDFSAAKFHQRCDGIPNTLTIIKNSKNIIYGGFSAPSWQKDQLDKYKPDQKSKSFVFSLTNEEKYPLFEKQYAIECNKFCGPIFGRVSVLSIYDKADKNNTYWHILPTSYHRPNQQWTQKSQQRFLGMQMYEKYTISEWQVFQVIFQN